MSKKCQLILVNESKRTAYIWNWFPSVRALTKHACQDRTIKYSYLGYFNKSMFQFDDEPKIKYHAFSINLSKYPGYEATLVHECSHAAHALYSWHRRRKMFPAKHSKDECLAYITEALYMVFRIWEARGFPAEKTGHATPYKSAIRHLDKLFEPRFWRSENSAQKGINP